MCIYMDCVYIAFFHLVSWEYYSDRIVCCCGSENLCRGRLVYNLKCVRRCGSCVQLMMSIGFAFFYLVVFYLY